MEPTVHARDFERSGYFALCGAGYPWPSSIAFERDNRKVTCSNCKKEWELRSAENPDFQLPF